MKKILFFALALGAVLPAYAWRVIPANMTLFEIRSVSEPMLEVRPPRSSWLRWVTLGLVDNAQALKMSPALRIRDEGNRFILRQYLPAQKGKVAAVRYDTMGMVNEIWLLTESEVDKYEAYLQREAERRERLKQQMEARRNSN